MSNFEGFCINMINISVLVNLNLLETMCRFVIGATCINSEYRVVQSNCTSIGSTGEKGIFQIQYFFKKKGFLLMIWSSIPNKFSFNFKKI